MRLNIGVVNGDGAAAARVAVDDTTRVVYLQGFSLYADLRFSPRVVEMCADFAGRRSGGEDTPGSLEHMPAKDLRELAGVLADAGVCHTAPLPGAADEALDGSYSCAADVIEPSVRLPHDHHTGQG